jgi:type I restriction enzyme S subunit
MTKKASTPALRFKGFTYTWEQRRLGEIATEMVAGGDIDKDLILDEGCYPVIANALTNDGIVGYYNSDYRIIVPAVTVTGRGDIGHAKARIINFTPVVRLLSIKSNHDVFFLENAINTLKIVIESTGVPQLTVPQLAKYEISFPKSLDEEERIGTYFRNLDHLITLHQRKYDKLTNMKKSMLEKMFPKNGANVPEIRFKGFTDAWEQRKLGEAVQEVTRNDATSDAPIMMITANNGFIEQSERYAFNNAGESLKKYILLEKGELAYNHGASKLRPYGSCFTLTTSENARIPFVYHCFSADEQNSEFLSIELNGADVENQLRRIVSSGARMDGLLNISFQEYVSVSVLLPTIEEQNKIADFFKNLDNLITLHQRELEKLKNFKKACLEKMFV